MTEWVTPTSEAEAVARRIRAVTSPLREVMTGEGGICFEWRRGEVFKTVEVDSTGRIEVCVFRDCKLVKRRKQAVPTH